MGQEIVYCFKCQIRLTGADLEKHALRWRHQVACKDCVPALLASMSPEERKAIEAPKAPPPSTARREVARGPGPGSSTRIKPLRDRSAPRPAPWLWIGMGGGVLVLVVAVAAGSGRSAPPPAPPPPPPPPPVPLADAAPKRAREAIDRAKQFVRDHPADLDGQVAIASEGVKAADATSLFREAVELYDAVVARRKSAHAEELAKVEKVVEDLEKAEQFAAALEALRRARAAHPGPEWTTKVDASNDALRKRVADLHRRLLEEARDPATAAGLRDRVSRWGLPEYGKELAEKAEEAARLSAALSKNGLLGWWKLDGETADSGPGAFSGTLQGNVLWAQGKSGGAAWFDNGGMIYVPRFPFPAKQVTIAAWVFHETLPPKVQRYVTVGKETAVLRHEPSARSLHFYVRTNGELRHLVVRNVLDVGRWHHVVATWDGATQKICRDGEEVASNRPGGTLTPEGADLKIGSDAETMHGLIDDVRVYGRALSETEIRALRSVAVSSPPPPDPRPWTPLFDGKTTSVLRDAEGWTVEDGALTQGGSPSSVQSATEVSDGEVRFLFDVAPGGIMFFRVRQGPQGSYSVEWHRPRIESVAGRPHELVFRMQGETVTATLDGEPERVRAAGKPRSGRIQFNSNGKIRIRAIEVR